MKKFIILLSLCLVLLYPAVYAESDEDRAVTRIDAVHMLQEILPVIGTGQPFDDTSDTGVCYFRSRKIVSPIEGNLFMPDKEVSTQEFLLMIKRAMDGACPDLFYDNTKIKWHIDQNEVHSPYANQVAMLSTVGVYNNSGYLKPTAIISKGMAGYYIDLAKNAIIEGLKCKNGQPAYSKVNALMYHVIDYPAEVFPYVYVSESNFEEQIKYLYENGYTFLFPEEISLADKIDKAVVITFDDGYTQTYDKAYPILKKYNAKATLYMIADYIGADGYCNPEQLFKLSDSGVFRVYSHTGSHNDLTTLTDEELVREFACSNDLIYNITGREVTSLSYPYGSFDNRVLNIAKRYYKNAFSVVKGGESIYELTRSTIDDTISVNTFPLYLR